MNMNLRVIKKGTVPTAAVQPFFFSDGRTEAYPEPYVLPTFSPSAPEEGEIQVETPPEPEAVDGTHSFSEEEIEQLKKDAFNQGHAAGHAEGHAEGLKTGEETAAARIEEMTKVYAGSLAEAAALKDTLRAQVENEVVRLALAVAKKIVHREIQIDDTIILALVRVALERVTGRSSVVVRLSPADYGYMAREHEDLAKKEGREIIFESDSTLTRGSCVIQSETGDISARIEEEFNEAENLFFEG